MGMLGMGNGAIFQMAPQRFSADIELITGIVVRPAAWVASFSLRTWRAQGYIGKLWNRTALLRGSNDLQCHATPGVWGPMEINLARQRSESHHGLQLQKLSTG